MIPLWLQAVVLGLVQGITEFVPVSSSGHLVLLPYLLSWEDPGLAFDVALHLGTALAITVYFRTELVGMALALTGASGTAGARERAMYRRLGVFLVVGSVPVAIVGLTLKETFEDLFATPQVAATFLLVTAGILVLGERVRSRRVARVAVADPGHAAVWQGDWVGAGVQGPGIAPLAGAGADPGDPAGLDLERITLREAVVIGLGQALALFPGLSRSGTTITAGLLAGLTRQAATRFSFLLGLPAMLGAALISLPDLAEPGPYSAAQIIAAVLVAFGAGYASIHFLVQLVARAGLNMFVRYLVAAAAIGWFGYVILGPASSF